MFWRRPILPGTSDLDQLDKIWQLCGTPNQISWPNFDTLPGCEGVKRFTMYPRRLKQTYETSVFHFVLQSTYDYDAYLRSRIGPETCDLLDKLLTCNPRERITAAQALDHDYFWTDPLPADPKRWVSFESSFMTSFLIQLSSASLPSYEASHEFDKRGRRNQAALGPPLAPRVDIAPRPLPVPTQPPPLHFNGRPPPPRDSYRGGPPHSHFPGQGSGNLYPPPPRFGAGPIAPPPATLPPIVLRPGQPPPAIWSVQPDRPLHLPPRPPDPMGRGGSGRYPRHEPVGGGELNYG